MVGAIGEGFQTSRALASAGSSVLTLAIGLLLPLTGAMMLRFPIKLLMMAGALFVLLQRSVGGVVNAGGHAI